MPTKPVSKEMARCITAAKKAGGTLWRWPGGYWMPREKKIGDYDPEIKNGVKEYFTAGTIHALRNRGLLILDNGNWWIARLTEAGQVWKEPAE